MDDKILGVFAKQPLPEQAKTRLARATSAAWAARVAQAFLEDSLDRFARIQATRVIVYAPAQGADFFGALSRGRHELLPQAEGDLGVRLAAYFDHARHRGFARIVAVGTDSPTLPVEYVDRAFDLLESADVVVGPAFDGGYYLIGSRHQDIRLFADIPWSTPRVLDETLGRIDAAGARLALLPPWYDVDTADDWAMLVGHVRAMRQAGIDPGVPRVEELMAAVIS